jgi:hypothetical protein
MNSIRSERPNITSIRISTNMKGMDIRMSTIRIMTLSTRPPT